MPAASPQPLGTPGDWAAVRAGITAGDDAIERHQLRKLLHDAVIADTGPVRTSGVRWIEYSPLETAAGLSALDELGYDTTLLREGIAARPGGWLVIAYASASERTADRNAWPTSVPIPSDVATTDIDRWKREAPKPAAPGVCAGCGVAIHDKAATRGACFACWPELPADDPTLLGTDEPNPTQPEGNTQ